MSKKPPAAFSELQQLSLQIQTFNSVLALLHWDQETFMPSGAITSRSDQIALLSKHIHNLQTSKQYTALLGKMVHHSTGTLKTKGLKREWQICLTQWHRDYVRKAKIPTTFVREFSQVTSEASQIWQTAKKENNFKLFQPFLDKIIRMSRERASMWGYEEQPYDALIAAYEPCMTSRKLQELFGKLRKELVSLLGKIEGSKQVDDRCVIGKFDPTQQMALGQKLLASLPLEMSYTRLDISAHPCSIAMHPHDSRITTRILPTGLMSNLLSVLHEAGHAMYEMGLPVQHWGTPLAEAASLSIHESQSRWWETLIGRSLPFWKHHYPLLKQAFPRRFKGVPLDTFYRAINKVSPSLIRVEADEVTYCLHVILRFELELELISGALPVADLPAAWKAKTKELLGIVPKTDREGCLQDIHWSLGDFGYFPTYALGNLFAAHCFGAFAKTHPDWSEFVAQGDLLFVRDWLKDNIHSKGKQYDLLQLAHRMTGKPFSANAYCSYLKSKYTDIYRL